MLNASFETADTTVGAFPGGADSWTWTTSTCISYAPYGASYGLSRWDGFEFGWGANIFFGTLEDTTRSPAVYGGLFFDGFETEWSNSAFEFFLSATENAAYTADPLPLTSDGLEVGWSNNNFVFLFTGAELDPALYATGMSPVSYDAFETKWRQNEFYITSFTSELDPAIYVENGGTSAAETFESMVLDMPFSVDPGGTNLIIAAAHGRSNGDRVKFFSAVDGTGGTLPTGISDRIKYHVINATPDTFQISQTSGGSPQTISDVGGGANFLRGDPALNWVGADGDSAGSDP